MRDAFGREIDYLRISITDRCNLRCKYCMPSDLTLVSMDDLLTYEEILEVAKAAASLGIRKIKVTGGEPLVRKGCVELVRMLKKVPGIEQVTITTNGILLEKYLPELVEAGIDGINISLDTMDRERFYKITGRDGFNQVLSSIRAACQTGVPVKLNVVSLDFARFPGIGEKAADSETANEKSEKGTDSKSMITASENAEIMKGEEKLQEDWRQLIELARELPLDVRFIEMMPIGFGRDFPAVSHDRFRRMLENSYPGIEADDRIHGNGPAVYYRIPGFCGSVGLISAIHGKFCNSCNRIRMTSQGQIKSCLCYDCGADLRPALRRQEGNTTASEKCSSELQQLLADAIWNKPGAHCFEHPEAMTEEKDMIAIGG